MAAVKHTIAGFITATPIRYGKERGQLTFSFSTYRPSAEFTPETVVVREHSFEVEVDDKFDPRSALVANLEEQKRLARAEFAKKVTELDAQIASLLAIENGSEE